MADPTPRAGARRADRRGGRRGRHRSRRSALPALVLAGVTALVVALGASGALQSTFALWSDTGTVTTGSFATGSMDMQLAAGGSATGGVGLGTGVTTSSVSFSSFSPGESKAFAVSVVNVGRPTFAWSATVTRGSSWTFVGTPITVRLFSGTPSNTSSYPLTGSCSGSAIGTLQLVDGTNKALLSSNRNVAGGTTDSVCMVVGVDSGADVNNQDKTGTLSIAFTANQVTS